MAAHNGSMPSKHTHDLIAGHADAIQTLQYVDEESSCRSSKGSRISDVAIPIEEHAVVQETSLACQQDQTNAVAQSLNDNDAVHASSPRRLIKPLPMSDIEPEITVEMATPTDDKPHQKDGKIRALLTRVPLKRKGNETKKEAKSQHDDINPSLLHPDWQPKTEKDNSTEAENQTPKAVLEAQKNMRKLRNLLYVIYGFASVTLIAVILIILSMAGVISLRIS